MQRVELRRTALRLLGARARYRALGGQAPAAPPTRPLVVAGGISAALGFLVLVGWHTRNVTLLWVHPALRQMQPNAALGFLLCGAALLAIVSGRLRLATVLAVFPLSLGLLTLVEIVLAVDLGIATLFFSPRGPMASGRIAVDSALCFVLTSAALLVLSRPRPPRQRPLVLGLTGLVIIAVSTAAFFGFATGIVPSSGWMRFTHMAIHTALGFVALGGGLIAFAWRDRSPTEKGPPRWFPLLVAVGLATATLWFWQVLAAKRRDENERVQSGVARVRDTIEDQLGSRVLALSRMAKRWEKWGKPSREVWDFDAGSLVEDDPSYQAVGWADPSFHLRWIAPLAGNEGLQDLDLTEDASWRRALASARDERHLATTRSNRRFTKDEGFLVYVPVFHGNEFGGLIVGVFRFRPFFDVILQTKLPTGYSMSVFEGNETLYSHYTGGIQKGDLSGEDLKVNLSCFPLWRVRIWPGAELTRGIQSLTPEVTLAAGLLVAALLGLAVHFAQTARLRVKETDLVNREMGKQMVDRRRAEEALGESEAKFRTLAETAPSAIFIHQDGRFLYANPAAATISGYAREEMSTINIRDLVHPEFRSIVEGQDFRRLREESESVRHETKIVRKDGGERWVDFSAGFITFGGKAAILGTAFDITERKRAEEQIKDLAYHDTLTGLPNRLLFRDRVSVALAQAHRHGEGLAMFFLDLDRFKEINDTMGHSLGDQLLKEVAERLQRGVREGDTVARLGGDEFTLLLPGVGLAVDAARVADKILESLRLPFRPAGHELFMTASMGISLYPDDGDTHEALLKNADTAMYRAKEQGRDNYQLYTSSMNLRAFARLGMENSLHRALAQKEFVVYYQPVLDLATGRIHGFEALLRWRHPDRGIVSPEEFIPLAEVTGLILPIGPWVQRTACAQAKAWQRLGHHLTVAVNLSPREFQRPDLVDQVRKILEETGLEPSRLDLEITESNAMHNAEATITTLQALRTLGVGISIDDFGTGYSSLSYLRRLPVNTLKIDQSFIRGITVNPSDAAITSAVIVMAKSLKLNVVAEGVETPEQMAFLSARACDRGQGFLFSHAVPAQECEALLEKYNGGGATRRSSADGLAAVGYD